MTAKSTVRPTGTLLRNGDWLAVDVRNPAGNSAHGVPVPIDQQAARRTTARGGVAFFVTISIVVILSMCALAIDLGGVYLSKGELQNAADAAALAAAEELLDEDRLKGAAHMAEEMTAARNEAVAYAARNKVGHMSPEIDRNDGNSGSGDVVVGYLYNPNNRSESLSTNDQSKFNSVMVRVRRDSSKNGPLMHLFAPIFGDLSSDVRASAIATFKDGVVGYKVTSRTGNAGLLPLALHVNAWTALLNGSGTDNYSYNPDTGEVTSGPDGILELNLYPGSGTGQLPPGNFGTVDIGSPNNSTSDLSRQIRYGINESDLSYFGGELKLGNNGILLLNGDTGLSAAIKDDLLSILGQPRAIPLFNAVSGNGNNSQFSVIGFVGIRIMNVKLTGSMKQKNVIVQPAFVVDDAAITAPGSGSSYFVYEPVRLVR